MANIVFTEKFYVNYSIRTESSYNDATKQWDSHKTKLGFATYYEENAAFRKRQATIDRWAGANSKADLVENKPRTGYVLSKSVTHGGGWNDTSVNWRVTDPLGFELEISSGNLNRILQYCTIEQGTILGECVWGWDKENGSKVVLLPVDCDLYKAATQTTARHFASTLPISDLQIGDEAEYKNGQMGTYMGKLKYATVSRSFDTLGKVEFNQQHCLLTDEKTLYFMKAPLITGAKEGKKRYTVEEAEKHLNDLIRADGTNLTSAGGYGAWSAVFMSYDKKPVVNVVAIAEPVSALTESIRTAYKNRRNGYMYSLQGEMPVYIAEDASGKKYFVANLANEVLGAGRSHQPSVDFLNSQADDVELSVIQLVNDDLSKGYDLVENPKYGQSTNGHYWGSREPQYAPIKRNLSTFVAVHRLEAQYKDWTYDLYKLR